MGLQELCRYYLGRLRGVADKHGLGQWVSDIIEANKRGQCVAVEEDVDMLSRLADEQRIGRHDIPKFLGVSYRDCVERGFFGKIRKLGHIGTYSRVDAILLKDKLGTRKKIVKNLVD